MTEAEFLRILVPALIGAIPALVIAINTNRLIAYRVDELAKKVEKHNQIVERTYKVESDVITLFKKQDDLKDDLNIIQQQIQQQTMHMEN